MVLLFSEVQSSYERFYLKVTLFLDWKTCFLFCFEMAQDFPNRSF